MARELFCLGLLDPDAGTHAAPVEHVNLGAQDVALAYNCGSPGHGWFTVKRAGGKKQRGGCCDDCSCFLFHN